jgi:spoIIIJ-associated protein
MENQTVETHGRTTDEAIRSALDQLGATRDEVEVEILAEGRSGVFGVGSQEARVRVTLIGEEDYEEDEEEEEEPDEFAPPRATISDDDADKARDVLEQMLDLLDFPNVVTVLSVGRDRGMANIMLDVAGDDVGLLIGRHGETLASVQFLLNACLGQALPRNTRVIVDIEHYRDRREQSLRGIALRTADRVRRERRAVSLQPMPPNDRRIIHLTLQSNPYVSTESSGEGPDRRVVVSPRQSAPSRRPSYGYRRG